ncbi:hypothetical protein niasHS_017023 [Heterodera schachtii]|uniref:Secreted protein n=1 Tax=Heterodera schachtii TaxID=97005 RepID=A0ABD2I403_HETSC
MMELLQNQCCRRAVHVFFCFVWPVVPAGAIHVHTARKNATPSSSHSFIFHCFCCSVQQHRQTDFASDERFFF